MPGCARSPATTDTSHPEQAAIKVFLAKPAHDLSESSLAGHDEVRDVGEFGDDVE
jgi:hypothetical protein